MLLREAFRNVIRRIRRTGFSLLTILVGAATLVVMLAVTRGSAHRTGVHLASLSTGSLVVAVESHVGGWEESEDALAERLLQVPGVQQAGTYTVLGEGRPKPVSTELATAEATRAVASARGIEAKGGQLLAGGWPSGQSLDADPRQILLGASTARTLGVWPEAGRNRVRLESGWHTVTGIVAGEGSSALLGTSLIHPAETGAAARGGTAAGSQRVLLLTAEGELAADDGAVTTAAWPYEPAQARVTRPISAASLQRKLLRDSQDMVVITMLVLTVSAAFSVYSTTQSAVWERRRHIGLDRALGASRRRILGLFLAESALAGGMGAFAGCCAGLFAGEVIALVQGWPHLQPWWTALIPAAGALLGGVSGAVPAWSASRVDPAQLLRAES